MKSIGCRKKLVPHRLMLLALALAVSFQDAQANDMDIVKKYAESDSIKVVFLESKPNLSAQASNVIEKISQTFDPGDQIEVTLKNETSGSSDPASQRNMNRGETESNQVSRQRQLVREQLSRASQEIERGNLTANSKYYRDLLESYKKLDEKYKQASEQMKATPKPIKKVLTVQSREQILKELKANQSGSSAILMIRRISFKDLAKGATGFIIAAGTTAQVMAADNAAKKAEAPPHIVQPKPYQSADGVN